MLKYKPFELIFSILLFMELELAMLMKIFESRLNS